MPASVASKRYAGGSDALVEKRLCLRSQRLERQWLQWSDLRHYAIEEADEASEQPGLAIFRSIGCLVVLASEREHEIGALDVRQLFHDFVTLVAPGRLGEGGINLAQRIAVSSEGEVFVAHDVGHFHRVRGEKGASEQRT